jgi:hypothetical protein
MCGCTGSLAQWSKATHKENFVYSIIAKMTAIELLHGQPVAQAG